MRPIDADVLTDILTTTIINKKNIAIFIGREDDPGIKMEIKAYRDILDDIKEQLTIELERETGAWIIDSEYPQHCWCSNCNHRFDLFDPKSIHFCPNCGREMKTCVWKSQDEREI